LNKTNQAKVDVKVKCAQNITKQMVTEINTLKNDNKWLVSKKVNNYFTIALDKTTNVHCMYPHLLVSKI